MAYTDIDDPSAHFQTVIWTGNDSNPRTISHGGNSDMQPDLLWHKLRSGILSHMLYDSTRGVGKRLHTDQTSGEATQSDTGTITAFTSNGFTVDAGTSNDLYVNDGSRTYVSWGWKVNGGTTTTNDASVTGVGDIDSVIQANQTAGISIVTYTGTDTAGETFAHGLGAIPDMVIIKRRGADGDDWAVQLATTLGNTNALRLNSAGAYTGSNGAGFWNDTSPTSTVMSLGTRAEVNSASTNTYVGYFFKSIQGYSKIGSYIGNGNASHSPFIYTGFKPAFVMIKRTSDSENWVIWDNQRDPFNNFYHVLLANATSAEDTSNAGSGGRFVGDFLSNGFKLRNSHATSNANASTYIYMAFAEHPFVSSEGVPTTAR